MAELDPSSEFLHQPVMLDEVVTVLSDVPNGVVVDATLGGGGHTDALLNANEGLSVIGLDRDQEALDAACTRLAPHGERVIGMHRRFDAITEVVRELGHDRVSACLFDLGVSSPQLDSARRGFSYRQNGPLDMRMDRSGGITGAEVVNSYDERALTSLLRRHGDEPNAQRIARAIVAARPVTSTTELAEVVRDAVPAAVRRRKGHPARRTFQAIRIEVNQELEILQDALTQALSLLAPRGRCAVLAYHSGEDRIVKRCFRDAAGESTPPRPGLPPLLGQEATVRLLWRGVRKPGNDEVAGNRRSEAARLRAVEKLETAQ
ncbi:MAG: 16S rRNA (cytosine(1402)-N(4))-methyltransferase RsmH [Acidimicrobiaceae bacterium]|nr:16S rRNA (cytosine(1402)-N(4))-methyltransferase RsmH [Acidimicrobiaceae bacterium]MYD05906.1 16S rRNA (cytosine(1402)-N(4))-methyltransferase RsmH [Acidimicrobiaceae bacterium]MYI58571.1 16S rRNA (cytosine(1402)-N(4))-methyltransferase RsmH [Acidimicrobiaceae bacterium]